MKAVYKRRLLKAADIVDKVPKRLFDIESIDAQCGTPACVLGHYGIAYPRSGVTKVLFGLRIVSLESAMSHFCLTEEETDELFSGWGCGDAKTGKQAAKYIRKFVERKEKEDRREQ